MSTTTKTPGYVSFCQSILADLRAAGIQLKDQPTVIDGLGGNKNWVCFQRIDNEQKFYVSRTDAKLVIHTTLKLDPQTPGYVDPKGKNPGKIESFFEGDLAKVRAHLLPLFVGTADRLRANKAPASRTASPAIAVGTEADLVAGL